jgi:cellulose synthase/poly-beta-1,6-N-acetylglucosamine synthase-like glycosyltransferase
MTISVPLFVVMLLYLYKYLVFFLGIFSLLNLIFILFAYFWTLRKKINYKSYSPNVSIIIPSFNEEAVIAECIDMVFSSNYDREKMDVVCADDGSTSKKTVMVVILHRFLSTCLNKTQTLS